MESRSLGIVYTKRLKSKIVLFALESELIARETRRSKDNCLHARSLSIIPGLGWQIGITDNRITRSYVL